MNDKIVHLNETNFEQAISGNQTGIVLIDFWAEWCGPCKTLAPILDDLAKDYSSDKLQIAKVDVDQNPQIAARFGIRSIPTLLLFKQGQLLETKVGVYGKADLKIWIDSHI